MKKAISAFLALLGLLSCLSLAACGESHEEWHQKQVKKGMAEAKKILGR